MHKLMIVFAVWAFAGCTLLRKTCPSGMVLVESARDGVRVCVDKYESTYGRSLAGGTPLFNMSYYHCQKLCQEDQKRLLSHKEWLVACRGTSVRHCNAHRAHPVETRLKKGIPWKFKGLDCRKPANSWGECLKDPSLNHMTNSLASNDEFDDCISDFGVFNMVGNLGEWVDGLKRNAKGQLVGRFNGGLYPQPRSSCKYTTIAHGPKYYDYSIGCRCGKSPRNFQEFERY